MGDQPDNRDALLTALRQALADYTAERARWPKNMRAQAQEEIADLIDILNRTAQGLGIHLAEGGESEDPRLEPKLSKDST